MKRWWFAAALTFVVALQPVAASTFIAMSPAELVRGSSAVVEGEVLRVESYWDAAGRIIVTEAMVQVRDVLAGETPSVVRVKTFGGTVDGYTVEAFGFPTFAKGERQVLFLAPDREPDMMRVTGYQQGQYRIVRDPAGVDRAVSALDDGALLLRADGSADRLPRLLPLTELKRRVRGEAERLAGGSGDR
jgi:hypothetical protein